MGQDDKARSDVEVELALKLLELDLEPSLENQILVLSMLYNKEESVIREWKRQGPSYYSDQVAKEAMLRWMYINRQMRKLGRLSAKSY